MFAGAVRKRVIGKKNGRVINQSLVATFKNMARMERFEYVGEILRPDAEPLSRRSLQGLFTHYYDLLRQAGEGIIR